MFRYYYHLFFYFFFSSRRRHTRFDCDWSSDVCSSDLGTSLRTQLRRRAGTPDYSDEDAEDIMRSDKGATTAATTPSVDRDAGREQPAHRPREPVLCAGCGAVSVRSRWSRSANARRRVAAA